MSQVGPAVARHGRRREICLTTFPSAGLMKFSRARMAGFPLSRQLTTSTTGYRTGSTPASFEPWTRASEVPPCEPQVGSANDVPAAVGMIVVSAPPTWNWVPVLLTQAACAGGGMAHRAPPEGSRPPHRRSERVCFSSLTSAFGCEVSRRRVTVIGRGETVDSLGSGVGGEGQREGCARTARPNCAVRDHTVDAMRESTAASALPSAPASLEPGFGARSYCAAAANRSIVHLRGRVFVLAFALSTEKRLGKA